jgi:hypothetical protein
MPNKTESLKLCQREVSLYLVERRFVPFSGSSICASSMTLSFLKISRVKRRWCDEVLGTLKKDDILAVLGTNALLLGKEPAIIIKASAVSR